MRRCIRVMATTWIAAALATSATLADTTLYLLGDGVPLASLAPAEPHRAGLPNYAPARDALPGLLVARGGSGAGETDPGRYQQWSTAGSPLTLDGPTSFEFWAATRDFGAGKRGVVTAFLLDCDSTGGSCIEVARGTRDIQDWSGGWGSWSRHLIGFGHVSRVIPEGRSLAVRVVVDAASDDDMLFAYGVADFPSRLYDTARDDTAIDCEFADWSDGDGVEFRIADQAGPDDWARPAKLDVTLFGVSSNLVDTVHVLVGFDSVPVNGGVAATLIDTDLDNNANFTLVATVDGPEAIVELYSCDDTSTEGCPNAVFIRDYGPSQHCTAPAGGPWNTDTLLEAALPFRDFQVEGGPIVLTSLVSYAAASLLNSPKDSVLGEGEQDYVAGIFYDLSTGHRRPTTGVTPDFLVRRSSDPVAVRAEAPIATVTTAPFDDAPGTLDDGRLYFYVVDKAGGVPVMLSANANRHDGAVRLGFDDGNGQSAPADPIESSVSADAAAVPADGTVVATITVVPRDANGVPLGSGCVLQVDAALLAPASVAGPVLDHHDGTYSIRIASTTPGTATIAVSVEGIPLAATPTIDFTTP